MKRKIVLAVLGLALVVGALTLYVAFTAGYPLAAAGRALSGGVGRLDEDRIIGAQEDLQRAVRQLNSPVARALRFVPVIGQNIEGLDAVASAAIPVLDSGRELSSAARSLEENGLINQGKVRLAALRELRPRLADQSAKLGRLERTLRAHRSGWLVPPLWSRFDEMLHRTEGLRAGATKAAELISLAPRMLGVNERRTYLVVLMNNAELRGAGGILSGIGTITASDGKLEIGAFHYYKQLADPHPYRSVAAPKDFKRNFARYNADTTRWVATTSSPDVPDVAVVAARLFRLVTGTRTDGTIVIDPRGIAALMRPGARIEIPRSDTTLKSKDIPRYVYSKAYEPERTQTERRQAVIAVGRAAFAEALKKGFTSLRSLRRAADATAGRHISFVSFRPAEQSALERVGVTSDVGTPTDDGLIATVQNYGGNKLDLYAQRLVGHACTVGDGAVTVCTTEVTIRNEVPPGLPEFVYQYKPYGEFRNFLEIYIPSDAALTRVEVDGEPARFFPAREDGYKAVGEYLEIPRNEQAHVLVEYKYREHNDGYSLVVTPQPLTHDAQLDLRVDLPSGWSIRAPDGTLQSDLDYSGPLDREIRLEAAPDQRTGLPALWQALVRFWNEPLF